MSVRNSLKWKSARREARTRRHERSSVRSSGSTFAICRNCGASRRMSSNDRICDKCLRRAVAELLPIGHEIREAVVSLAGCGCEVWSRDRAVKYVRDQSTMAMERRDALLAKRHKDWESRQSARRKG